MEPIRWPTTVWQPGWESSPVVDFVVQHADALQKACLGVALAAGIGATGGLLLGLLGAGEAAGAGALIFAL
ncbi:MAG: hypothetical protein Q7S68_01760 [Deltaproteobacteria bacterium]|nr:hypothetical protein [Deltaproteobacteria bacterium]